ncbi:hypothetical protein JVU11DRAFT_424 [Chiua virens]|nr:hypothetical protein JVU11DRAFT_424 [Chiua virens]
MSSRITFLGLAQLRNQLRRTFPRLPTIHPLRAPAHLRSSFLRPHRQFSESSRPRVQYTRFSDGGYTYYTRRPDRDRVAKILVFVTAAGVVYYVAHLEQVPETGRWRFMDISPKYEATLEKSSYAMLLSEFDGKILPPHHPITRHVHRVVSNLLEASDLGTLHAHSPRPKVTDDNGFWQDDPFGAEPTHNAPDKVSREWNLLVVDDPKMINALTSYGTPHQRSLSPTPTPVSSGTIVVFTGILPVCRDEQGLAAVIGHGTFARHASERYSSSKILLVLATLLSAVGFDFGMARLLNYIIFSLPNSRTQELEADTLGMGIASKACYDPQSAVEMHTRLARANESGVLGRIELLNTHPLPERRIKVSMVVHLVADVINGFNAQHLEELVPEANEIRAASPRCAGVRESIEQFLGSVNRWG